MIRLTNGTANPVTPQQLIEMGFTKSGQFFHLSIGEIGSLHVSLPNYICLVSCEGHGIDFPTKLLTTSKINSFINTYTEGNARDKHHRVTPQKPFNTRRYYSRQPSTDFNRQDTGHR